jgi:hypothetical protein
LSDRVLLNERDNWTGPDYAVGLVDEIVVSDAVTHFEMLNDATAYMTVSRPDRHLHIRLAAVRNTRAERADILRRDETRLVDHLSWLNPWNGRFFWSLPMWRRPWAVVRSWWVDREAASVSLRVTLAEDVEA